MRFWHFTQSRVRSLLGRFLPFIARPLAILGCLGCVLLGLSAGAVDRLPPPQAHPLPSGLAAWVDRDRQGDYFDQIPKTQAEYLIWSQFPVKVYVEPVSKSTPLVRSQAWVKAVEQAIVEWNAFLPLQVVDLPEGADIRVLRSGLPLRVVTQPNGKLSLPRLRSAETRYELYARSIPNASAILAHRCTVVVQPNQAIEYILASARHELGHALGIWGHSLLQTDALYFSQVRHPPLISARDVNTLKRVYEQPTRLGWPLGSDRSSRH
ncbi:MAG: peptidase [Leptolyngbyaceae cyanobacterium CSU_1_3]|nr:peptidase [Leptolyngbyaceae cyanobacterium CSU_1_3]